MFVQSHRRSSRGRHVVSLPMIPRVRKLGSSKEVVARRFFIPERKFDRLPIYKAKCIEFMEVMLELGHMVEAKEPPKPQDMVYYIPHRGIMSSRRSRVVFDVSRPTKLGIHSIARNTLDLDHSAF